MASKAVTISPPAALAAGSAATCDSYDRTSDAAGWVEFYQLVATPAAGWQLKEMRWDFVRTGEGAGTTSYVRTSSPWPPTQDRTNPDALTICEGVTIYPPGSGTVTAAWTLQNIEVEFVEIAPAHTHLLVNSSTVETPAKLVYDPATNKLVADC